MEFTLMEALQERVCELCQAVLKWEELCFN